MSTSTNQKPMWQVSFGQATERCHVATSTLTFLDTSAPLRKCTRRLDRPHGGTAPPPLSPLCSRPHSAPNAPVVWTGLTVAPPAAVVAALLAASQRPRSASTIRPRPLRATPFRVRHPFAARFVRHPFACDTLSQRASDFGVPPILRLGPVLCAFWCGPLVLAPVLSSSRRRTPPPPRRRRRRRAPPPPPPHSRTTTITTATATVGAPATATTTTIAPRAPASAAVPPFALTIDCANDPHAPRRRPRGQPKFLTHPSCRCVPLRR